MVNFSVHVEEFGKIERATIEVAPFTLFIGDNNSGKSYLLTLLYGLFGEQFDKIVYNGLKNEECPHFKKVVKSFEKSINNWYYLNEDDISIIEDVLNKILAKEKDVFVKQLFKTEIPIGKIEISFPNKAIEPKIRARIIDSSVVSADDGKNEAKNSTSIETQLSDGEKGLVYRDATAKDSLKIKTAMLMYMITKTLIPGEYRSSPIYLPASRTGFLLTHRHLPFSKTILNDVQEEPAKFDLTTPVSDFIDRMRTCTNQAKAKESSVSKFIEEKILHGTIKLDDMPQPGILYFPENSEIALPMQVSSDVVTELVPLWLILNKSKMQINFVMNEEPEMCLHPKLQKFMAQALIRIVNAGMHVVITTHSDIILNHVNNMIKLPNATNRDELIEKYGYVTEDLLGKEQVQVYQFDVDTATQKTKAAGLERDNYGSFMVDTFNYALTEMLEETDDIDCGAEG